jgi:hypothetical protein
MTARAWHMRGLREHLQDTRIGGWHLPLNPKSTLWRSAGDASENDNRWLIISSLGAVGIAVGLHSEELEYSPSKPQELSLGLRSRFLPPVLQRPRRGRSKSKSTKKLGVADPETPRRGVVRPGDIDFPVCGARTCSSNQAGATCIRGSPILRTILGTHETR